MLTCRRRFIDEYLKEAPFDGCVLDVGGKKALKRGEFRPPLERVAEWKYLNIDAATSPDYLCGAEDIPVADAKFDTVLFAEVIEHLVQPDKVLRESCRVVKKNGRLIATMPFLFPVHGDPEDYQRWSPTKIRNELDQAGFDVEKLEPMGGAFAVIHDLFLAWSKGAGCERPSWMRQAVRRIVMPVLGPLLRGMDARIGRCGLALTTGYYVVATKR